LATLSAKKNPTPCTRHGPSPQPANHCSRMRAQTSHVTRQPRSTPKWPIAAHCC
jgi:hypothetical protein